MVSTRSLPDTTAITPKYWPCWLWQVGVGKTNVWRTANVLHAYFKNVYDPFMQDMPVTGNLSSGTQPGFQCHQHRTLGSSSLHQSHMRYNSLSPTQHSTTSITVGHWVMLAGADRNWIPKCPEDTRSGEAAIKRNASRPLRLHHLVFGATVKTQGWLGKACSLLPSIVHLIEHIKNTAHWGEGEGESNMCMKFAQRIMHSGFKRSPQISQLKVVGADSQSEVNCLLACPLCSSYMD